MVQASQNADDSMMVSRQFKALFLTQTSTTEENKSTETIQKSMIECFPPNLYTKCTCKSSCAKKGIHYAQFIGDTEE